MRMNDLDRPSQTPDGEKLPLTSWKEIAAYLQVSVKTAQRYETEHGLPVKRLGGRVSIALSELMAWQLASESKKPTPWWTNVRNLQIGFTLSGGLAVLAVMAVVGYFYFQRAGQPAFVHIDGSLLTARDESGRQVWQHRFDAPVLAAGEPPSLRHQLADIDKDGQVETVGVWQHVLRDSKGWAVHCLSSDGNIRWMLNMEDRVTTASGKEFGPPYVVRATTLLDSPENDGTQWVAAVFVHVTDVLSTLVVVDSRGKRRGQYWHSGHLNALQMFDADGDGKKEIVVGGVRHGVEQAVIVAFDPILVSGANAMPEKHPRAIIGKGPSSEKLTGFIARSILSKRLGSFNYISEFLLVNGNLRAHVFESLQTPEGYLLYDFGPGLRIYELTMSVAFIDAHQRLRLRKELGEMIPERELERLRKEFRVETGR